MKMIALVILAITVLSCSKKENDFINPITKNEFNTESLTITSDGILKFPNREIFDKYCVQLRQYSEDDFNKWEEKLGFISLRRKRIKDFNINDKNSTLNDDLFKTFLTEEGLIQIGEIVYKVAFDDDKVWSLIENYTATDPQNLIDSDFDDSTMNIYSCSSETFDIIDDAESGNSGYNTQVTGFFGSDIKRNDDQPIHCAKYDPSNGTTIYFDSIFRADCKTSYQKVGIYFSVIAEMNYKVKTTGQWFWTNLNTDITMNAN